MRRRLLFGLTILCAIAAILLMPWLALREARQQAFENASELILLPARDILHRADEASAQAETAIARLGAARFAPCSAPELALMRHLNLSYPYLQAVGRVAHGKMVCSSMGAAAFDMGEATFRTPNRAVLYTAIPPDAAGKSPLFGIERDSFGVLIHRALPLDTWNAIPGLSLGLFQVDRSITSGPELATGIVSRNWLTRLDGKTDQAVFAADGHLVAVARSRRFRIASVAAVPIAFLDERTAALAVRIVPAGLVAGLAIAIAILSLARRQRSLPALLRHALAHQEIFVQYQPIVELASGRCIGAEALVRWRRSSGELLGPDLFVPVAEQFGLITQLTERVLRQVESDAGKFLAERPDFHVAINLSVADLHSPAIVGLVDRFLHDTGAVAANLIMEITERGLIDREAAQGVIGALRARGIEIAIDDFGTGYSSLSYLESLELDILKIDRSFVEAIGTKALTNQLVPHIIAMARTLNLRMVAEGVETAAQAQFLNAQGVQYAQGWLFGKPTDFAAVAQRYREHGTPAALLVAEG